MAKPPTDIEPSELYLKLRERPAPSEVFAFPRRGDDGNPIFDVRIFVLPEKKLAECRFRARAWVMSRAKESISATQVLDEHIIGDQLAKEVLAEAIHENRLIYGSDEHGAPQYHKLFRNAEDVGELTADEVAGLYGAYLLTQARFGPTDTSFADETEINAWVERLKAGAAPFALTLLASHQRDELLLSLTDRVSAVLSILASQPESWPASLESLRTNWQVGIDSYTEPAASDSHSSDDEQKTITPGDAMAAARALRRKSQIEE